MDGDAQPIRCTPVLYFAPVFWLEHYWSESARRWADVGPSTPLADRPFVEIEVGLDTTLGDILEKACDELGILPGPDMIHQGSTRRGEIARFAFVEEEADRNGIDAQVGYQWPSRLPAPGADGGVNLVDGRDVTMRQLLAASGLGLIRGDVSRPYLFPVVPQGAGQVITDLGQIAPEVVRASLAVVRGMGGDFMHVVRSAPGVLRGADRYVSEHPIETGLGVGGLRWLKSKIWRLKDGTSGRGGNPV
jgi:hypothetical protein